MMTRIGVHHRQNTHLSPIELFLRFGSEVTELGYLNNQFIFNLKGSNLRRVLVLL